MPALLLCGAPSSASAATTKPLSAYIVMTGQDPLVRVILDQSDTCPALSVDGRQQAMSVRAEPGDMPIRPTRSTARNSKPSRFPIRVCEAAISRKARRVTVDGVGLPPLPRKANRIVVIGDTGCRIKASDNAAQACNDPAAWPFARIAAQAAAWKPDLVLHVGDFLYRENPCPDGNASCSGTPWGYGWDAWKADFFTPAAPLLRAAPWIMVRGNHENCRRAGQGWWRFLDPHPLIAGRDCNEAMNDTQGDQTPPYAVPLGDDAQIIVMDLAIAGEDPISDTDPRYPWMIATQMAVAHLAKGHRYTFATDHYPILGLAGTKAKGEIILKPGNAAIRSTFGRADPSLALPGIDMLIAGHVHEWQMTDFKDHPGQLISGMSGTQEDTVAIPAERAGGAEPAPGARVEHFDSLVDRFGFMTLQRKGARRWAVQVHAMSGEIERDCLIRGRRLSCTQNDDHRAHK